MAQYQEPSRSLPVREFDVVVAGAGTGGVIAALAAAESGASVAVVEAKGYPGGIAVEGGTALHSYYNLWKAFPGVAKRQVVKGLPQRLIDRLAERGATTGHAEMDVGYDYDSVCTAIDTELYKLVAFEMLAEAGVHIFVNTLLVGAVRDGQRVTGVIVESRSGREMFAARSFVDCTGYGDLCAFAAAAFTEPNDHPVANSIGVGGVSMERYHAFLAEHDALTQLSRGRRSGRDDQIVRLSGKAVSLPEGFRDGARAIGMATVTTTVHDDYFMFIKLNHKMPVSPTDRDAVTAAELELRKRQEKAVELFRRFVPGCEKAFIARTSPSLSIRRGRRIICDYDISREDITSARHFDDDVMAYGFHDCAPRIQVGGGQTYGIPYRALCARDVANLYATGMMITEDWEAHMSTRNTVCCMGQGQAAGVAAALCAQQGCGSRDLKYDELRSALVRGGVHLEN